jgi:hypothetical protein
MVAVVRIGMWTAGPSPRNRTEAGLEGLVSELSTPPSSSIPCTTADAPSLSSFDCTCAAQQMTCTTHACVEKLRIRPSRRTRAGAKPGNPRVGRDTTQVRKDMDLRRVFHVGQFKDEIKAQLRKDVEFLQSFRLMDYSMMVGVSALAPCGVAVCAVVCTTVCADACTTSLHLLRGGPLLRCMHRISPLATLLHAAKLCPDACTAFLRKLLCCTRWAFTPMPPFVIHYRCIALRLHIFFRSVVHSLFVSLFCMICVVVLHSVSLF